MCEEQCSVYVIEYMCLITQVQSLNMVSSASCQLFELLKDRQTIRIITPPTSVIQTSSTARPDFELNGVPLKSVSIGFGSRHSHPELRLRKDATVEHLPRVSRIAK